MWQRLMEAVECSAAMYLGNQLLAVQQQNAVYWMHEDPIVKSKRITNGSGNVVSTVELDRWGGSTSRNNNNAFQPHKFTTYERDGNASDEAMFRRYNRWWSRFDQPDPYDGSYDFTNPQSFNRYAYVQNDPVNLVDPTGLEPCTDEQGRTVDCPHVDDGDIIRTYTLAPALSPFYIPASTSGGSDIFVTLIQPRTPIPQNPVPAPAICPQRRCWRPGPG